MKNLKYLYQIIVWLMIALAAGLVPAIAIADGTDSLLLSVSTDKTTAYAGDNITFTYVVTNAGVSTVDNLTITENRTGSLMLSKTSLSVGENATGTVVYVVKTTDLPGPLVTSVLVKGITVAGENVTAVASVSVTLKSADIGEDDKDVDNDDNSTLTKSEILKEKGVRGKGIDHAPGLQKSFNENSQALNHVGKNEKNQDKHRYGNGHGYQDDD